MSLADNFTILKINKHFSPQIFRQLLYLDSKTMANKAYSIQIFSGVYFAGERIDPGWYEGNQILLCLFENMAYLHYFHVGVPRKYMRSFLRADNRSISSRIIHMDHQRQKVFVQIVFNFSIMIMTNFFEVQQQNKIIRSMIYFLIS